MKVLHLLLLLLAAAVLEMGLRIADFPKDELLQTNTPSILLKKGPVYNKYFCDNYHKRIAAQDHLAQCVERDVKINKSKYKEAWIFGGSTALEDECEVNRGGKTWTSQLREKYTKTTFRNYAEYDMTTSEMVSTLDRLLAQRQAPNLIILALYGLPEEHVLGDERDPNYHQIYKRFNLPPTHLQNVIEGWTLRLLQVEMLIHQKFHLYHLLKKIIPIHFSQNEYTDEMAIWWEDHKNEGPVILPWEHDFVSGIFNVPTRYTLGEASLKYSLMNSTINFEKFVQLAKEKNIDFVCVLSPFIEHFYRSDLPYLNRRLDHWLLSFYEQTKALCKAAGFPVVDGQQCIQKAMEEDGALVN